MFTTNINIDKPTYYDSNDLSLPCKSPGICVSGKLCQNTKTPGCCWHEDKRTNKNIIYIDGYGDIDLTAFSLTIPPDIQYCPSCKVTKETLGEIIERIRKMLPSPEEYQRMLTMKQKEIERKMKERQKIEDARRAKKEAQKPHCKNRYYGCICLNH